MKNNPELVFATVIVAAFLMAAIVGVSKAHYRAQVEIAKIECVQPAQEQK